MITNSGPIWHLMTSVSLGCAGRSDHGTLLFWGGGESLPVHRCQPYQQSERQIKHITGESRVHSTSYDTGSCFAMV